MQSLFIFFPSSALERRQNDRYRHRRTSSHCVFGCLLAHGDSGNGYVSALITLPLFNRANDFEIHYFCTQMRRKEHHYLIWFILIYAERTGVESWFAAAAKLEKWEKKKRIKKLQRKIMTSNGTNSTTFSLWNKLLCCVVYVYLSFVCVISYVQSCQRRDGEIERENKSEACNVDVMENEFN